MASLTGSTIASSYEQLLSLPDGGLNGNTLVAITDGDSSTAIGMKVATSKIEIIPASDDANAFEVSNAAGTAILTINSSTTSASLVQTVTTATSTPKALFIDTNTSGVAAQNSVGMHLDFDRTVAGSGTAAHNDIGIDLDVNSASLGTSSLVGMDIDVVGATSGTSTATGLTVDVGSADTNYAALFNGGNVGIGSTAPGTTLVVNGGETSAFFTRSGASAGDHNIMMNTDEVVNNRNQILFNAVTSQTTGGIGQSSATTYGAVTGKITQAHSSALKGEISLYVNTGDTTTEAVTVTDAANLEIVAGHLIIDSDTKGLVLGADQDVTLFASAPGEMYVVRGTDVTPTPGETTGWVYMAVGDSGSTYMTIAGGETGAAILNLYADNGDDNDDKYKIEAQTDGTLSFNTYSAGSWTTNMAIDGSVGSVRMATQPAFLVQPSSTQTNIAIDDYRAIAFGTEVFDQGSDFASNTFTAPVTGKYQLNISIRLNNVQYDAAYYQLRVDTSNRDYYPIFDPDFGQDAAMWSMNFAVLVDMDANDTVSIDIYQSGGTTGETDIENSSTYFSGFLAC
jgi:hypothetical protein